MCEKTAHASRFPPAPTRWLTRGATCHRRSRQRHNAQYQGSDVTIHYPYHPRCGERVAVWRRHEFRGKTMLVVRQPDGTMAQIPQWMCTPEAAVAPILQAPRFPLQVLRELRLCVDAAVALLSGSNGGERHGTSRDAHPARSIRSGKSSGVLAATDKANLACVAGASAPGSDDARDTGTGRR